MIEAVAFASICFIICNSCTFRDRLKKGAWGAILFVALFHSYNILQPLLPSEIDNLLHSTIWGVLFAYAVPTANPSKKEDEKNEDCDEKDCVEKKPENDETPPISDLN